MYSMKRLFLLFLIFASLRGYSAELQDHRMQIDEIVVNGISQCDSILDNVHHIYTVGNNSLQGIVYLEGKKINLKLVNNNRRYVRYYLIGNGFVHPFNEPVGKEKVDSIYTYDGTLAPGDSAAYTIGHRSMIPVIAHGGVPADMNDTIAVAKAYLDMLYAGFDVSTCLSTNRNNLNNKLRIAETKGLQLIIGEKGQSNNWYRSLVNEAGAYKSAVYGYYIGDEPFLVHDSNSHPTIDDLLPRVDAIHRVDSSAIIRICLNPIYWHAMYDKDNQGRLLRYNNKRYDEYIETCISRLKLKNLAFDNYSVSTAKDPITGNSKRVLKRQWFDNLEIIRSHSIKHHIPFCGYVLSAKHLTYMLPTIGTMRLQMYANLAYGAKSIAYYTYWHRWLRNEGSYYAPVDTSGNRRKDLYYALNRVNEEMARVSPLFAEGTVQQVYHINEASSNTLVKLLTPEQLPDNIDSLVFEGKKGAIASIITKGDSTFLVIVNKDFEDSARLHIKGNRYLYHVSKLNLNNEVITTGDYVIDPGDIIIFNLT